MWNQERLGSGPFKGPRDHDTTCDRDEQMFLAIIDQTVSSLVDQAINVLGSGLRILDDKK